MSSTTVSPIQEVKVLRADKPASIQMRTDSHLRAALAREKESYQQLFRENQLLHRQVLDMREEIKRLLSSKEAFMRSVPTSDHEAVKLQLWHLKEVLCLNESISELSSRSIYDPQTPQSMGKSSMSLKGTTPPVSPLLHHSKVRFNRAAEMDKVRDVSFLDTPNSFLSNRDDVADVGPPLSPPGSSFDTSKPTQSREERDAELRDKLEITETSLEVDNDLGN